MTEPPSSAPTSAFFTVKCPGCGQRLRFAVSAETPPRVRVQCSARGTAFAVRRPGGEATGSIQIQQGSAPTPPTLVGQPAISGVSGVSGVSVAPALSARLPGEPAFALGDVIAERYRVVRFVARGGMGEVYEVEDAELRDRVALKTVRPELSRDTLAVERFKREIQLARKVTHPNVCRIFDIAHHRGGTGGDHGETVIFLTMELLSGETLAQRLKVRGPIPTKEALPLVRQIAEALHAAHQSGIVHRDFKPGNVMLSEGRGGVRAVVTDFGLARLEAGAAGHGVDAVTLTGATGIVGTPAYLAPEQVEGGDITPAVDIYALGIVLYEMLTGRVPFTAESALATAVKRLKEVPVSPRVHFPGIEPRWERTILRCLERRPADRFPTALAAAEALTAQSPPHAPPAQSPSQAPQARRPPEPTTERSAVTAPKPVPVRRPIDQARRRKVLALVAVIALAFGVAAYRGVVWWRERTSAVRLLELSGKIEARRSVAVLGFKNLSGRPEEEWLASALSEMIASELGSGAKLRVIPGESVAHAAVDLPAEPGGALSPGAVERARLLLGADAVVAGSYVVTGEPGQKQIRLDVRLAGGAGGVSEGGEGGRSTIVETGSEADLFALVSRAGTRLRKEIGARAAGGTRQALPKHRDAARLYAEGLAKLRLFEPAAARDLLERAVEIEPTNAVAHSALSAALASLGYDERARSEAKAALDLAAGLPREEKLLIEGRYLETVQDWPRAIATYRTVWALYPDSLDHGLRLAAAQTAAGSLDQALVTVAALRTLPAPAKDDPRIDLAEAVAAGARSDFRRQRHAAERAAARGRAQGRTLILAQALLLECRALRNLGEADGALAACQEGRQLYAKAGDRAGEAEAMTHTANVRFDRGDAAAATRGYEQALATYRAIGNRGAEAGALNNIAVVLRNQGKLADAARLYDEVLAISREIGSSTAEGIALNNLGGVLVRKGELARAADLFGKARALRRQQQDRAGEASALDNLGVVRRKQGDLTAARKQHEAALAIRREIGQAIGEAGSLNNLGNVMLDQGELKAAEQSYRTALAIAEKADNKSTEAYSLFGLGEVRFRQGRVNEARTHHQAALAIRERLGDLATVAESQLALAWVAGEGGDFTKARQLAQAAAAELGRQGAADLQALALASNAVFEERSGRRIESQSSLIQAETLAPGTENLRCRLLTELYSARLRRDPQSGDRLRRTIEQAGAAGLLEVRLEAELALVEVDGAGAAARETVAQQAAALGYGLIAKRAGGEG